MKTKKPIVKKSKSDKANQLKQEKRMATIGRKSRAKVFRDEVTGEVI